MKVKKLLLLLLLFFIIIVPVGLLTENPAWGEWGLEYFKKLLGYIPKGIENSKEIIKPLIPDYSIDEEHKVISYYFSAIIGVISIFIFFYLLKFLVNKKRNNET